MEEVMKLAWALSAILLTTITSAYAERFNASTRYWKKEGAYWIEYPAYAPGYHFTFSELTRDSVYVVLFDPTRKFIFRLPLSGGITSWTTPSRNDWANYLSVSYTR